VYLKDGSCFAMCYPASACHGCRGKGERALPQAGQTLVQTAPGRAPLTRTDTRAHTCTRAPQVNTSGEEAKSGVDPEGCVPLAAHIARECPSLKLAGLMTIGMQDYTSTPENFKCLAQCRCAVAGG